MGLVLGLGRFRRPRLIRRHVYPLRLHEANTQTDKIGRALHRRHLRLRRETSHQADRSCIASTGRRSRQRAVGIQRRRSSASVCSALAQRLLSACSALSYQLYVWMTFNVGPRANPRTELRVVRAARYVGREPSDQAAGIDPSPTSTPSSTQPSGVSWQPL
jgi:hypothetical protein